MSRSQDYTEELSLLAGGHLPKPPSEGPTKDLLQAFPNRSLGRPYVIEIVFPEFTSLCPVTGQPDFGCIRVEYIPFERCVESKSFKLYMHAFRDHQSFMETTTNKILTDLHAVLDPLWIRVQGLFVPRGGTRINVYAEREKKLSGVKARRIRRCIDAYRSDVSLEHSPYSSR